MEIEMTAPATTYTDADLQAASEAIAREWGYANLTEADSVPDREGEAVRAAARVVLAALAAAGRLASARPTPHLDAVKAERDKLRDANDTLALTLAEAIGALVPDGGGCSRGWIPNSTVDRWRRALHEAEEARRD